MSSHQQEPLWRECVNWLIDLKILRRDQFPFNSELCSFVQYIRDGVLLCHLITKIDPRVMDFREVFQRTQMSQYMSLKNIRLFLRACKKFDLKDSDLFEPSHLFDYTNFGKVLHTLSKLSKCPKVLRLGVEGFPALQTELDSNEDEIYRRLEEVENQDEQYSEYCYAPTDENIYEDLCSLTNSRSAQANSLLPQTPKDKRDYSVNEIIDTEKNYIDALNLIITKFIVPLTSGNPNLLNEDEKNCIFFGIENLYEIHSGMHEDLVRACANVNDIKLYSVFLNWKEKLLVYGEFCANLTLAQHQIETVMRGSKVVADEIERCQREASKSAYLNLKDLITLPMQRVLKYPLLLKTLCSYTDKNHEDYSGLCLAYEAVVDLAEYINEAKRDYEMIQIIHEVQASISDWSAENNSLIEYGRLIKDGELKMRSHEDSRNAKLRYVFILNRCVIFCKATRGEQYSLRLILPLDKYKLEDCLTQRSQNTRESRWTHQWLLVDHQNKTAHTLYAKTADSKNSWMRAFNDAMESLYPFESRETNHNFSLYTCDTSAENCKICKKLFKGTIFQGYKCTKCHITAHKACLGVIRSCPPPPTPPPRPAIRSFQLPMPPTSPISNLDRISHSELDRYPWYAGEMSRPAAAAILRNTPIGTFLCRFKSNENAYALSLKTGDEIKHMKVVQITDSNLVGRRSYCLSETYSFRSLVELVSHHAHNSLRESFHGLDAFLEVPWKNKFLTARAIEDYIAENENMNLLSIFKGQHIIIVSKEGDGTGWWKGKFYDSEGDKKEGYFPKEYVREDNFFQE